MRYSSLVLMIFGLQFSSCAKETSETKGVTTGGTFKTNTSNEKVWQDDNIGAQQNINAEKGTWEDAEGKVIASVCTKGGPVTFDNGADNDPNTMEDNRIWGWETDAAGNGFSCIYE